MSKYVDVNSAFPAGVSNIGSFGGLVLSGNAGNFAEESEYLNGKVVALSLAEVSDAFGAESDEYKFASRYYGYIAPTGEMPSALQFFYVKPDEDKSAAINRAMTESMQFGSLTFLSVGSDESTAGGDDVQSYVDAATTVAGYGGKFLFVYNDVRGDQTAAEVAAKKQLFEGVTGCGFVSGKEACSGYMPMAIFAATDFENGQVSSYMFRQFPGEQPSVLNDADYEAFKAANVNFYGRAQTNGQTIDFFQRGFCTDGMDLASFCNEAWFRARCEQSLMGLLVSSNIVPATDEGVELVKATVRTQCRQAVTNGMFQRKQVVDDNGNIKNLILNNLGGTIDDYNTLIDDVQLSGYYIYATLSQVVAGVLGSEYAIRYYVFYGTAEGVRFIKGTDMMLR